ncbi:hypothetical protein AVEN_196579-1 [Araneus ventricosus]|uniref:Uncharacterized protein n=1 Tax=Araneus ventricosus TaxID=182803 RepID=A0A4Y2RC80_ARAVE|nr:hypothetical protein AVEN_196579-1 [Araneus ventricosus]
MGRGVLAIDFRLEPLQQFLSFGNSMGIVMQEDDAITQYARVFMSEDFTWPSDYFLFPKLKEHLSGNRCSSESDVKTVAEDWINGQRCDFC